jgi:hypothetical protein
LTKVTDPNDTDIIAEYTYDALGRRVQSILYDNGVADSTTNYYYDGWRVLTETDVDGETESHLRDYIYGNYLDEVLVMTDASDDDHYYAHDHLFSVVALINEDGDVLERYEHDAYGKSYFFDPNFVELVVQKSNYNNVILFTGQRYDYLDNGNLCKYYYKFRDQEISTGGFYQRDPIGERDGICIVKFHDYGSPTFDHLYKMGVPNFKNPSSFTNFAKIVIGDDRYDRFDPKNQYMSGTNLYEYVKSNPLVFLDPYGLRTWGVFDWFYERQRNCGPWKTHNDAKPEWVLLGVFTPTEYSNISLPAGPLGEVITTVNECFLNNNVVADEPGIPPGASPNRGFGCYCKYRNRQKCERCCSVKRKFRRSTNTLDLEGRVVVESYYKHVETYMDVQYVWGTSVLKVPGLIVDFGDPGPSDDYCSCERMEPETSAPPACNNSCK